MSDQQPEQPVSGFKTFAQEFTFAEVDHDLLGLLTGGALGNPSPPHSIEIYQRTPVRRRAWRVVWEWLARKPRQYNEYKIIVPNATLVAFDDETGETT